MHFFPLAHDKTIYLYRGLQGVTRGYRGLQGVTGGYRGLQRVTRGYRGLQGVTGERERFKLICQKKKKKSKFWLLRMLEKDDDLFNYYARVVGKYAVFVVTLCLAIGRETGRNSTQ